MTGSCSTTRSGSDKNLSGSTAWGTYISSFALAFTYRLVQTPSPYVCNTLCRSQRAAAWFRCNRRGAGDQTHVKQLHGRECEQVERHLHAASYMTKGDDV